MRYFYKDKSWDRLISFHFSGWMMSFGFNRNVINNKSALCDVVTDFFAFSFFCFVCLLFLQMQLLPLFRRVERRRSNFHLPLSGCGVGFGPVGAASLRRLPLYKQVCFQLDVFRVGSPLEPMKDTDAVGGRLLPAPLWLHQQPGLEKGGGVLKCAPV